MLSALRLGWLRFWGSVANLAGFPGIVREGQYVSQRGVTVRVRTSTLYTTVTVNGVDVYFYRLSGGIDGVGFSRAADYTASETPRSARSPCAHVPVQSPAIHRRTTRRRAALYKIA